MYIYKVLINPPKQMSCLSYPIANLYALNNKAITLPESQRLCVHYLVPIR